MFTDKCPRCNTPMSIGNTTGQCPYSCYLCSHLPSYSMERYVVGNYIIYNVLELGGMYSQIFERAKEEDIELLLLRNVYLPFNKMTESKVKIYLTFS